MVKYYWLLILLFFFSCHDKKPSLSDNQPVEADDFFAAFQPIKLPYNAADTSLAGMGDTTTISTSVLMQFIPDSATKMNMPKTLKNASVTIHPVGKIETKNELYLLLAAKTKSNASVFVCVFSNNKKEKKFLSSLPLVISKNDDGYAHAVDINSEPTFTITKNKMVTGQLKYTRNGYAYNSSAKGFIEVINESNEDAKKNSAVINPIDTMAKSFTYSGDYKKDKMNFISLRDGNMAGRYTFFLHFEKNKGECVGELKGTLSMIDATKAVFQQSGDPCVIDFILAKNSVQVKERGSCGNHRGITCQFDDTYRKEKINSLPPKRR